jgi:CheY-like chemotaxis protein
MAKAKKWSAEATEHSDGLGLEEGIFEPHAPKRIAASLKRSAEKSRRRKTTPFQSAMSMSAFFANRAGRNLPARRRGPDLIPGGFLCTIGGAAAGGRREEGISVQAVDEKADGRVSGLRVLVVEDEFLVALLLEDMLGELGHRVIGPVADVAEALVMAQREDVEIAILDVNLAGTDTYSIAAALSARGIPFIFATGYARANLRDPYRDAPLLQKPFQMSDLEKALLTPFSASGA